MAASPGGCAGPGGEVGMTTGAAGFVPASRSATERMSLVRAVEADPTGPELARHILTFDPDRPEQRMFTVAAELPRIILEPIPWPAGLEPTPVLLSPSPAPGDALPQADVLVVTWTVAEAKALADVLTPGVPSSSWTQYRHKWTSYLPHIRRGAPAREAHALGAYCLTKIGAKRVVCMKSDLHMSQDGPDLPVRTLWKQIITETGAGLVITTGTAGGIGATTTLGDVIVSKTVRFDCIRTFKNETFAQSTYSDAKPEGVSGPHLAFAEQTLLPINAAQLPAGDGKPKVRINGPEDGAEVLTTDFFAFDDVENSYGLRTYDPRARAVEMGDAVLGLVATADLESPPAWVCVRNASDPQMPQGASISDEAKQAAGIYEHYGYLTTVGSAITCWALIAA
jgi:nucleoside phosphorylase